MSHKRKEVVKAEGGNLWIPQNRKLIVSSYMSPMNKKGLIFAAFILCLPICSFIFLAIAVRKYTASDGVLVLQNLNTGSFWFIAFIIINIFALFCSVLIGINAVVGEKMTEILQDFKDKATIAVVMTFIFGMPLFIIPTFLNPQTFMGKPVLRTTLVEVTENGVEYNIQEKHTSAAFYYSPEGYKKSDKKDTYSFKRDISTDEGPLFTTVTVKYSLDEKENTELREASKKKDLEVYEDSHGRIIQVLPNGELQELKQE